MSSVKSFEEAMGQISGADFKKARTVEGNQRTEITVPDGVYKTRMRVSIGAVPDKGPIIGFEHSVAEGQFADETAPSKHFLWGDKRQVNLERLIRELKTAFPEDAAAISKMGGPEITAYLKELSECEFTARVKVSTSDYNGKEYRNAETLSARIIEDEGEDDEDLNLVVEDELEEDQNELPPEEEEEEEDDLGEDDPYFPAKGDIVTVGRSEYEVTGVQEAKETVTLKNTSTGKTRKNVPFDDLGVPS